MVLNKLMERIKETIMKKKKKKETNEKFNKNKKKLKIICIQV